MKVRSHHTGRGYQADKVSLWAPTGFHGFQSNVTHFLNWLSSQNQTYFFGQLFNSLTTIGSDSVSNLLQWFAVRQVLQDLISVVKPTKTESATVSAVTAVMVELVNFQL